MTAAGAPAGGSDRVRVKVCGLTRPEDAAAAEAAGADALGVIFAARSRRRVDAVQARRVLDAAGPFVARVGVFVDAPVDEVLATVAAARLGVVQLHGRADAATVAAIAAVVPVLRAVSWTPGLDPAALDLGSVAALLVDGPEPGSGRAFDWDAAAARLAGGPRWVLAGGLTPETVAGAIARLRPYAVDVASGVEAALGVKDPAKLRAFVAAVRGA
ncbi:MAG: phosphoribosylanthranilate isomerase [Trueperaceae bacterium]|nr:phosphoribosylanthranilate isomerase [Trueperaceae bacterium]